ncbi:MAG TPA: hypothetical protein VIZ32_07475, partial [Vicinamibacterales bacterium]
MTRAIVFAAAFAAMSATSSAQAPAARGVSAPGEVVVGSGNYSPIVQDLDKAIEFYGGLLGSPCRLRRHQDRGLSAPIPRSAT